MTKSCLFLSLMAVAACGTKAPPVVPPEPTQEPTPPPPPVDAAVAEPPDAAPQAVAPPPSKIFSLCSIPTDAAKAQCLTWQGCAGGIVETYAAKPIRKCSASESMCGDAEKKLQDEADKLKASGAGAPRVCKLRNYLKKEIRIDESVAQVCPEDSDDRALSELWRQIASTCKAPITD